MITFPKAKINLGLRITAKRQDGYHDIETVFYPICLSDALEFVVADGKADRDEIAVTGFNIAANFENNLVIKAIRRLREDYFVPFLKIHLHKAIPSGAGLGGGSSDAAFMLKAISRHFCFSIAENKINTIALELGSDCPFFINPVPSYATGKGEILRSVEPVLKGYYIVLLNPGFSISTIEAYLNCHPAEPEVSLEKLITLPPGKWKNMIINDFEDYAINLCPQIGNLKNTLYKSGAVYSAMSGSGSAVYGIFAGRPEIPVKLKDYLIYEGVM